MCGFVGYIDMRRQREVEQQILTQMTQTLVHRGPDSSGYFVEEHVGLGFRRLSIIDIEGGDQPLYNEDGSIVLMCNGEIFNYRELKNT
jgi:asparagine synthase (glutamine-hydrolysing)